MFTAAVTEASFSGASALNASLRLAGMTTSFTSGLPSRETWTKSPPGVDEPSAPWVVMLARSVVDQTPMTGSPPSTSPRLALGTCRATELTL